MNGEPSPDTSAQRPERMSRWHEMMNARRARTHFHDETGPYYTLDNAAIIMPAVSDARNTFLFRMSATLDHPVVLSALSAAMGRAAKRFPYFMVELKRGFFWYFLQPMDRVPVPQYDNGPPNMGFRLRHRGEFLFRVRVSGKRIACEFTHILSDGTGCFAFLKCLLIEYFRELGVASTLGPDDMAIGDEPDPAEYEDAYHRFYKPGVPGPGPVPQAYHIESRLMPVGEYRVTCGIMPVAALAAQAKARGVSITEFLVATYLHALIRIRQADVEAGRKPRPVVSLEVPVNMRKFYPTKTLRNFSLFALPSVDTRLGKWTFDELVAHVHHQLRIEADERRMATQIARNAGGGRKLIVRLFPLALKDFFAHLLFERLGEGMMSGMLSNLGPVSMPPEISPRIERFDFVGAPSKIIKTGASMLSWNGDAHVSFHSMAESREVERLFFSHLSSLGVPVRVECSMEAQNGNLRKMRSRYRRCGRFLSPMRNGGSRLPGKVPCP